MPALSRLRDNRTLFLVLLMLFAAAALWYWREDSPLLTPATEPEDADSPDAFVVAGRYRTFNADGQLASVLTSSRAVHYPRDNTGHLDSPQVDVIQKDGRPWQINAQKGVLALDTDVVQLRENVRIQTLPTEDQPALTMTTETLTLDNRTGFITTDQPVNIASSQGQTTAVGLDAYVDEKRMILKSQVRSTYDPVAP